jgi:hypothetical protein
MQHPAFAPGGCGNGESNGCTLSGACPQVPGGLRQRLSVVRKPTQAKEEAMFGAIGESAVHQIPRGGGFISGTEQDVVVQKAEQVIHARPVENSGDSGKPKADSQDEDNLTSRNRLEEGGKITVETYDETGNVVKVTPPGYMPLGKIA